jgi:serine/threonine-protein kinase
VGINAVLAASAVPLIGASLLFGSFVLVPALASTGMVLAASHLRPGTRGAVIVLGVLVVLLPFALGELSVLEPSYLFLDDQVHIMPRLVHFPPGASKVLLVLATIVTLAVPSLLAGQLRDRLALAEKRLFLTAWHLERLGKQLTRPHLVAAVARAATPSTPAPTAADSLS